MPTASPRASRRPSIKARSIDDVPILALTFHSNRYDHLALRRIAAQVDAEIKRVPEVSETTLIGGVRRQLRVRLDPAALAARSLGAAEVAGALGQSNSQASAGSLTVANQDVVVQTGAFFTSADDVGAAVVGVYQGNPVHLRDVAQVTDDAEEPSNYVFYGSGAATSGAANQEAGGHARRREAARHERHRCGRRRARTGRPAEAHGHPGGRLGLDHAPLRRDRRREVERALWCTWGSPS